MVGWYHQLNGHESEQTLGDSGGQRSLASCDPWGHKESDMTGQLTTTNKYEPGLPEFGLSPQAAADGLRVFDKSLTLSEPCFPYFNSCKIRLLNGTFQGLRGRREWRVV